MLFHAILVGVSLIVEALARSSQVNVRLMSYNIRKSVEDEVPGGELWPIRRQLMTSQLKYEASGRPDTIMCFQDAREQQIKDLQDDLGEDWAYVGVSPDSSDPTGEFSPIFYRPSVWQLDKNATLWLSETPEKPASRSWSALHPRIVTVARFSHVDMHTPLVYMCTRFDHVSQKARIQSAKLIVETAETWASNGKRAHVFVGGDFNSRPDDAAYTILATTMHDVKDVVPQERHFGHIHTYTNFTVGRMDDQIIDHIFVNDDDGLEWDVFTVLNNRFDDRVFISDHRPVVVGFKFRAKTKQRTEKARI